MDSQSPTPACPLTDDQIAQAADRALGLANPAPVQTSGATPPALARFQSILTTLAQPALEPAPEALISRLIALSSNAKPALADRVGDRLAALASGVRESIRTVLATLTFDSRVSPALAGFRGSASAIQLAFTCDAGEVHIQINEPEAPETLVTVRAVFDPADPDTMPAGRMVLTHDSHPPVSAPIDEDGMVLLRAPAGTYHATIEVAGLVLDMGRIQIP